MGFEYAVTARENIGSMSVTYGTFTNGGGDVGGNIATGMRRVEMMMLAYSGAAAITEAPSINATFPCDGSSVAIVTPAGADGYWIAWGYL